MESAQADYLLDLIDAELCARSDHGEVIDASELFNRFPSRRSDIEELLEIHSIDLIANETPHRPGHNDTIEIGPYLVLLKDRTTSTDVPYLNATNRKTGDRVSIIGHPRTESTDLIEQKLFRKMGQIQKLTHPNLHPMVDFGKTADLYYAAFAPLEGTVLNQQLSAPIQESRAIEWLSTIARTCHWTWLQESPYLRVSSDNLLIDHNNCLKLIDPGVTEWRAYLEAKPVDESDCLRELGILLFSMLVGTCETLDLEAHLDAGHAPIDLTQIDAAISPDASAVFAACVHPVRKRRYQRMDDLCSDLDSFSSGNRLIAHKLRSRFF